MNRTRKQRPLYIYLKYLPKQRGGRLYNLSTFKVLCSAEGAHGKLIGEKTLKSPEDSDDYIHVIKSKMDETDLIVKVQENGRLLNRELEIQTILQDQNNVIKFICSFECNFDRFIWDKPLEAPKTFCDNTGDRLSLIIMEYINNDLADFLESGNYTDNVITSILKQVGLALFEIHFNHGVSHNDINRGNILLDINEPKTISYKSGALAFDVDTHGHEIILIDFQRSTISKTKNPKDMVQYTTDEISLAYYIISRWTKDLKLRNYIQTIMNNVMGAKTKRGLFSVLTSIDYR